MKAKRPKPKRKRDPAKEPFASKHTEVELKRVILRANADDATDADIDILRGEFKRAGAKQVAALEQKATPIEEWGAFGARFEVPDLSASSAVATASAIMPTLDEWMITGAKARRQRKQALRRTQLAMNRDTPATHAKWDKARVAVLNERKALISDRELARLVCRRVPGAKFDTVRIWLASERKRLGRPKGWITR